MPASEREVVDITAVIKNILDSYPAGSAVLREFLQNSDDCGAKSQDFILDTRKSPTQALVDPALASCQGPALFAINDGIFCEKDWYGLKHIRDSPKAADEAATGKYGMGFRSCYHVTDNPHILSGDRLLLLDPHNRVEKYPGGFSLRLNDKKERLQYRDHFHAFRSVLSESDKVYNGTAIRLPLRLPKEAKQSKIKDIATTVDDVRNMLNEFVQKELQDVLLFLKNITEVGLYEIGADGRKNQIARAWVEDPDTIAHQRSVDRGREEESSIYELRLHADIGGKRSTQGWILTQFVEDWEVAEGIITAQCGRGLLHLMASEKLLPHVALAYPIPDATVSSLPNGKLFTLLPLPIVTKFPLHIHAIFALAPDRQSFKNMHDVAIGSREKFLLDWNQTIFFEFVPRAWIFLLKHVVNQVGRRSVRPYALWPQVEARDQDYWKGMSGALLRRAALEEIWPVVSQDRHGISTTGYHTLDHVLLAPTTGATSELLAVLSDCGVPISNPPEHVYALVQRSKIYSSRLMTPETVVDAIKLVNPGLNGVSPRSCKMICDYISTGEDINLFRDISVIPCANGKWTSIKPGTSYILATPEEANLFGANPQFCFLALDQIEEKTKELLLSGPWNKRIHALQPDHVVKFLVQRCSPIRSVTGTISTEAREVGWRVKFWNWIVGWQEAQGNTNIQNRFNNLHILPLTTYGGRYEIRMFSKASIDPTHADDELLRVFEELRLPVLHSTVAATTPILGPGIRSASDVQFVLSELSNRSSFSLEQPLCKRLHDYFTTQLPTLPQRLTASEIEVLRLLPIYPVLRKGLRTTHRYAFKPGPESSWLVDDTIEVVPIVQGKPIIAASECRTILDAMYKRHQIKIARESEVLEHAVRTWEEQRHDEDLASLLIGRIISRLADLSAQTLKLVAKLPIVDVGSGSVNLRSPAETVDPSSSIAQLFDDDERVLPQGLFALDSSKPYLKQLQSHGLMSSSLSPTMVTQRIGRLTDPATTVLNKGVKAKVLLQLLDEFIKKQGVPEEAVPAIQSKPWLLASGPWPLEDDTYICPSQGWDMRPDDIPLCNRVLPMVNHVVTSARLRIVLGWQTLPFDVLKQQYLAVVSDVTTPETKDVIPIVKELAKRLYLETCTEADLQTLAQNLEGKPWVPATHELCLPSSRMVLKHVELRSRFHQVLPIDQAVLRCFQVMGIPDRPTYDTLCAVLSEISEELSQSEIDGDTTRILISTSLKILSEIFQYHPSTAAVEPGRSRILIPTSTDVLHPMNATLFNDMGSDILGMDDIFLAHPDISADDAETMGLIKLSDQQFATENDLGDLQLGEDFCVKIYGVLKEYQMESAWDAWITDAEDAKATNVAFIVDGANIEDYKFLNPRSATQCQGPALIIWNNETLGEEDFEGLISTTEAWKRGNYEAIGRFGLTALSFYCFTEMVTIVSGNRVLFLDPSGTYLPRSSPRSPSTVLSKSLENCQSGYPGHLRPFDGLFEFSSTTSDYKGTLIRLPLRTRQQAVNSRLSSRSYDAQELQTVIETKFYDQAEQSLFFSHIVKISAEYRNPGKDRSALWSIHGTRKPSATGGWFGGHLESAEMRLETIGKNGRIQVQNWLIHYRKVRNDEIPEVFYRPTGGHFHLSRSIGLAMRLIPKEPKDSTRQSPPTPSRLFTTAPLATETKLPVHLHATWILGGDRRKIRFDVKNADGAQSMEMQYNLYILEKLVPELYLQTLVTLATHYPQDWNRCWPGNTYDHLQPLVDELYKQFATTSHRVCHTVTGTTVAPPNAIFSIFDVPHVQAVLEALNLPHFVSPPPFDRSLVAWEGLHTDDAAGVAKILRSYDGAVRGLFEENISPPQPPSHQTQSVLQPQQPSFAQQHLNGIIQYLAEADLTGLPLLQLGNGDITTFEDAHKLWVFREISHASPAGSILSISTLFASRHVIGPAISDATCELLIKRGGNVRNLDAGGIRQLLGIDPCSSVPVSEGRVQWLRRFLAFLAACKNLTLDDISDLPLIPLMSRNIAISPAKAANTTVFTTGSIAALSSPDLFSHLGILVIQSGQGLPSKPPVDLETLMGAFQSLRKNLARLNKGVQDHDWRSLMQWIKGDLGSLRRLSPSGRETLLAIPIFEAQKGSQDSIKALHPANEIHMLPPEAQLASFARYLPRHTYFADNNDALSAALDGRSDQVLSHEDLFRRLQLPVTISADEDHHFQHVLSVVISNRRSRNLSGLLVPDMDHILRKPEELYDHRVDLFRAAFGNRHTKFLHSTYRASIESFVQVGLRTEPDLRTLIDCVTAIDEDVRAEEFDQGRATEVWSIFADSNAIRGLELNAISKLRFIPYNSCRHDVIEFAVFARSLQDLYVASPQELVRAECAPVVWTQRACFATTHPIFITTIMPNFGVPNAEEVVHHLEVLATKIAPRYPSNPSLRDDLFKTYDWLLARIEDARYHLAQHTTSMLWLNINDFSDNWTWRSGSQLVLDLRFDDPQNEHYDVKGRLLPYKDLLIAAGAHEQVQLSVPEGFALEGERTYAEGLRLRLENLLQNRRMTDIQFEVGGETIRAHRAVLAASMDHGMAALPGPYPDGEVAASDEAPVVFPTAGVTSAFAMRSLVDYAYTGTFAPPPCNTTEDAGPALESLLALLDLSNMWNMGGLKDKAQRVIIELRLVRQETYTEILERAEACAANVLVTACHEMETHVAQW
ncbi:hypothetical protein FRB94_006525 [Tulasnella sp. JGI-2019a]|nr:hypothetical protein FRB93_004860 [Tulasnella sp. JGI-2019a]KAG8998908.1 hypothetical protein FRB94_006525 [Tulasnella sp. JGI-2019a]